MIFNFTIKIIPLDNTYPLLAHSTYYSPIFWLTTYLPWLILALPTLLPSFYTCIGTLKISYCLYLALPYMISIIVSVTVQKHWLVDSAYIYILFMMYACNLFRCNRDWQIRVQDKLWTSQWWRFCDSLVILGRFVPLSKFYFLIYHANFKWVHSYFVSRKKSYQTPPKFWRTYDSDRIGRCRKFSVNNLVGGKEAIMFLLRFERKFGAAASNHRGKSEKASLIIITVPSSWIILVCLAWHPYKHDCMM